MNDQFIRDRSGKIIGKMDGPWIRDGQGKLRARYDKWDNRTRSADGKILGDNDQRSRTLNNTDC